MAYNIIGRVYKIGRTQEIQTKSGTPFRKRTLTLMQQQYDRNTGEQYEPNFPSFEFTQKACEQLDALHPNQLVRVSFDLAGRKYINKQTGEEDFFTSLRAFRVEPYALQQGGLQSPQVSSPDKATPAEPYTTSQQGGVQPPQYDSHRATPADMYARMYTPNAQAVHQTQGVAQQPAQTNDLPF
jgi:single-strand DNA-binding protein